MVVLKAGSFTFQKNGDLCAKSNAFIRPSAHFGSKSCVGQHVPSMSATFVRDQSSSVKYQTLCQMCSPASNWTSRIPIVLHVNVSDVFVFLVPALTLVVFTQADPRQSWMCLPGRELSISATCPAHRTLRFDIRSVHVSFCWSCSPQVTSW